MLHDHDSEEISDGKIYGSMFVESIDHLCILIVDAGAIKYAWHKLVI